MVEGLDEQCCMRSELPFSFSALGRIATYGTTVNGTANALNVWANQRALGSRLARQLPVRANTYVRRPVFVRISERSFRVVRSTYVLAF
jgi:hypothetical protein